MSPLHTTEIGILQESVFRAPFAVTISDVTCVMSHCMHSSLCTDNFAMYYRLNDCQSHVRMLLKHLCSKLGVHTSPD
jgi:hypothetical protein